MVKILAIIGLGMPASLLFTAQVAVGIRSLCRTQVEPQPPLQAQAPFSRAHYLAWGAPARLWPRGQRRPALIHACVQSPGECQTAAGAVVVPHEPGHAQAGQ
jgi:hypothetical protein